MDLNPDNTASEDQGKKIEEQPALEPQPDEGQAVIQPGAEAGEIPAAEEEVPPPQEEIPTPGKEETLPPPEELVPPPVPEPEPESALARGFRRAVQWAIIGLLLLAIGGGLAYFLIAQPARSELKSVKADLQAVQEKLTQSESDLAAAQSELAGAKNVLQANEQLQLDASNRIQFLRVMSSINTARYSIVKKQGATAHLALLDAQADLKPILEMLKTKDEQLGVLLSTRLERAISNLSGDPAIAESDLNTLVQDMGQLEDLLFPE